MLDQLNSGLRDMARGLPRRIDAALNETVIRVAVTGLSRSGKTVFMTSLIHNLLAFGQGRNTLPRLQTALNTNGGSRLRNVRIARAGAATTPQFDFDAKFANLASSNPAWPERTEDIAQITLEMEIERANGITQKLGPQRVRLELLDYPGEWLLDLPLLSQSYRSWSEATLALLEQPTRRSVCAGFLEFLKTIEPHTTIDPRDAAVETVIRHGYDLYRAALLDCRARFGFRYLQPGRFVCPGPRGDLPFMWFFPIEQVPKHASSRTMGGLLQENFETYKAEVRAQFFDTHFANFDRQIVLVDVLSALHGGKEAYEDTKRAIADIATHLSYGSNKLFLLKQFGRVTLELMEKRLLRQPAGKIARQAADALSMKHIERVAFAATKADHVPVMRRENLKNLLRAIAENAGSNGVLGGRPVTYHTVASVLSTTDATATVDGRPVEVVMGLPLGEQRQRPFHPGDVPSGPPPENFWSDRFFQLPIFAPPKIDPEGRAGIPQLGVDEVLVAILKDVL